MTSPPALPTQLLLAPFRTGEARALGVPRSILESRSLFAPHRGVRTLAEPGDLVERCEAYLPLLPQSSYFSHVTAAALWGLWLPRRFEDSPLHVTARLPVRAPRMVAVVGHSSSLTDARVVLRRGLPLNSAVEAWCQLAGVLSDDELIEAGDSLVRRKYPLAERAQLAEALRRNVGRRGAVALHTAFQLVRSGCDSPRETRVRLILVRAGLPEPRVDPEISPPGERVRYGDLVYERWRVLVEYDGMHHLTPAQRATDIERLERLRAQGWLIITVIASHLDHPAQIVARVEAALLSRGWTRA